MRDNGESALRLKEYLGMRRIAIGVAVVEDESKIPKDAYRPFREDGRHYAMCQAMTLVKEKHITVALGREDHWCWKPLIGFGLVDMEPGSRAFDIGIRNNGVQDLEVSAQNFMELPRLPRSDDNVILIGPMDSCSFEPDVILIYCDAMPQLRWMVGALKYRTGRRLATEFDYIDSCLWSVLPTMLSGEPRVTLPDPGEETRGECPGDEIILSVSPRSFGQLVDDTIMKLGNHNRRLKNSDGSYKMESGMVPDFPRPRFYNELFEIWGLKADGVVAWSEKERE